MSTYSKGVNIQTEDSKYVSRQSYQVHLSKLSNLNTQTGESNQSFISSDRDSDFDFFNNDGKNKDVPFDYRQKPLG